MAIELEDLVHAVASGALRALKARGGADTKANVELSQIGGSQPPAGGSGFFVDLHFRCGIPPYLEAAKVALEAEGQTGA